MGRKRSDSVQVWATVPQDLHRKMQEMIARRGLGGVRNADGVIIVEALTAFLSSVTPAPALPAEADDDKPLTW